MENIQFDKAPESATEDRKDSKRVQKIGGGICLIFAGMATVWLSMPASQGHVEASNVTLTSESTPATTMTAAAPTMVAQASAGFPETAPEPLPEVLKQAASALVGTPVTAIPVPTQVAVTPASLLPQTMRVVPAQPAKAPTVAGVSSDTLAVNIGQSAVINAPWPVARVSITNPDIADVQVLTPEQVLLVGKELGTTDMVMWGDDDQIWHTRIAVNIDVEYVRQELLKIFPESGLSVTQSRNVLVVGGQLRRLEQIDQLRGTLDSYGLDYIDKTSVAGVKQVAINVRVAEVSRQAIRSLGVNTAYAGSDFFGGITIGPESGGAINPVNIGAPAGSAVGAVPFSFIEDLGVASGITMFGGIPSANLEIFIEALAENQYLRVLAEPTLVAMSGAEASFLAGGEFPIPIVQGTNVGAGSTITIEYKEYGVRLNFLPIVLGENRIRLSVAPEVSDISEIGAVEIDGFQIPAITTRRSETTLEMNSGELFAMAGLLNQTLQVRNSRVPILGDLPVLGPLFRSVRYKEGETELLVLVTASLVEAADMSPEFPVPGDLHERPNDWELYADGRLEGATPALAPEDATWFKETGLDRLRGPGAWASHDQPR